MWREEAERRGGKLSAPSSIGCKGGRRRIVVVVVVVVVAARPDGKTMIQQGRSAGHQRRNGDHIPQELVDSLLAIRCFERIDILEVVMPCGCHGFPCECHSGPLQVMAPIGEELPNLDTSHGMHRCRRWRLANETKMGSVTNKPRRVDEAVRLQLIVRMRTAGPCVKVTSTGSFFV